MIDFDHFHGYSGICACCGGGATLVSSESRAATWESCQACADKGKRPAEKDAPVQLRLL